MVAAQHFFTVLGLKRRSFELRHIRDLVVQWLEVQEPTLEHSNVPNLLISGEIDGGAQYLEDEGRHVCCWHGFPLKFGQIVIHGIVSCSNYLNNHVGHPGVMAPTK